MKRVETHDFAEPIDVCLPKYPCLQRVLGVEHKRNPNGLFGRRRFVYAIAEWQLPGSDRWLEVRDLVTLMRLANAVEHPYPRNTEHYASAW
jgi:hypothetical protein